MAFITLLLKTNNMKECTGITGNYYITELNLIKGNSFDDIHLKYLQSISNDLDKIHFNLIKNLLNNENK